MSETPPEVVAQFDQWLAETRTQLARLGELLRSMVTRFGQLPGCAEFCATVSLGECVVKGLRTAHGAGPSLGVLPSLVAVAVHDSQDAELAVFGDRVRSNIAELQGVVRRLVRDQGELDGVMTFVGYLQDAPSGLPEVLTAVLLETV